MNIVNVRLIGPSEADVQRAIDELTYLTSGIVDRLGTSTELRMRAPRQGRRDEWLAYGTLVITEAPS